VVFYEHFKRHLRSLGKWHQIIALKGVSSNLRALAKKGLRIKMLNAAIASCVRRFSRLFNSLELLILVLNGECSVFTGI